MSETKRYRLSIPMEVETREALDQLAAALGSSSGQTAGKFLDQLRPQFIAIAEAMEVARKDPNRAAEIMGQAVQQVTDEAQGAQVDLEQAIKDADNNAGG